MNGVPSESSCFTTGQGDGARDLVDERGLAAELLGEPRQRGVRAHAARVRALVAVERALEVLRGAERAHGVAVAQEEQRHLGPGQELLDEHGPVGKVVLRVRERGGAIGGDDDALARGEAVGLHHVGRAELVEGGLDLGDRRGAEGPPGRHAGLVHDPLRERLRALQLRGRATGAEHRDAVLAHHVGDARHERRLGSDDHEIDVVLVGELPHRGAVHGIHLDERRVLRDPGVPRGAEDLVRLPLRAQGEDDRVLTSTGTEDEDLHPASLPRRRRQMTAGLGRFARSHPWTSPYAGALRVTQEQAAQSHLIRLNPSRIRRCVLQNAEGSCAMARRG